MINLEKTYELFKTDHNPFVTIHPQAYQAPYYFTGNLTETDLDVDSFFANTQFQCSNSHPRLELYIHPLAELSRDLPPELVDIMQDAKLTEKERENKVKGFLKGKWERDQITEDFSHLSFYMKLWQGPDLASEASKFGIARHRSLHNRMWNRKTELLSVANGVFYSELLSLLIDTYLTWTTPQLLTFSIASQAHNYKSIRLVRQILFLCESQPNPLTAVAFSAGALFNFCMLRKRLNFELSFKSHQVASIDLEALKMTQNLPGALHYLESVKAYNHSGLIWRITSCLPKIGKSISEKRLENLCLKGNNFISIEESNSGYTRRISALFWKVVYPLTLPFRFIHYLVAYMRSEFTPICKNRTINLI